MPFLDRLEERIEHFWLRLVAWLNGIMMSFVGAVGTASATYPDSTKAFFKHLPEWLIFPAAIAFCLVVNHALKKAKKAD